MTFMDSVRAGASVRPERQPTYTGKTFPAERLCVQFLSMPAVGRFLVLCLLSALAFPAGTAAMALMNR